MPKGPLFPRCVLSYNLVVSRVRSSSYLALGADGVAIVPMRKQRLRHNSTVLLSSLLSTSIAPTYHHNTKICRVILFTSSSYGGASHSRISTSGDQGILYLQVPGGNISLFYVLSHRHNQSPYSVLTVFVRNAHFDPLLRIPGFMTDVFLHAPLFRPI
jgi:hypothetical protein